jgi:hypothetical protein
MDRLLLDDNKSFDTRAGHTFSSSCGAIPARHQDLDLENASSDNHNEWIKPLRQPDLRIESFPAFATSLSSAQRRSLNGYAAAIARRRNGSDRIRGVAVIGHAAEWSNTPAAVYARNAMDRARHVANYLAGRLRAFGIDVAIRNEGSRTIPSGKLKGVCIVGRGAEVALCVGHRSISQPLVPSFPHSASAVAQGNRASNRRVDLYNIGKRPAPTPKGDLKPHGPVPDPPQPPSGPLPITKLVCIIGASSAQRRQILSSAAETRKALARAVKRMDALAAMDEQTRSAAWNMGAERVWFGRYGRTGRMPFNAVRNIVRSMQLALEGKRLVSGAPCAHRMQRLTIECFPCPGKAPSRAVCNAVDARAAAKDTPGQRWKNAAPRDRIATERRKQDEEYFCCRERDTYGASYVIRYRKKLWPASKRGVQQRPYKVQLGPVWFRRPARFDPDQWRVERRMTIAHEIAHLSGAWRRYFGETYGRDEAMRLAKISPRLARLNAEGYGHYVMGFVSP